MNLTNTQMHSDGIAPVTADIIIIGAGITGAALSYELATQGVQVLLIDRALPNVQNATRYSYGGISYWAGTNDITRLLCEEGIEIHRTLSETLDAPTEFRELPLLSTIGPDEDVEKISKSFQDFSISPQRLTPKEAQELEPLLNPNALSAALLMPYAHIHPQKTALAYQEAFVRLGGVIQVDRIVHIEARETGVQLTGEQRQYHADQVIVCAGGEARSLMHHSGYPVRQYFSHAESMEIDCRELQARSIQLSAVVMPAEIRRFQLEAKAANYDADWVEGLDAIVPDILDSGAIQFADGSLCFGQISRIYPSLQLRSDPTLSETRLRQAVGKILPDLAALPGTWVTCTVAFSADHLPIVGSLTPDDRVQVFSGFSNPMALFPATARRFAQQLAQKQLDPVLASFAPDRFGL